MARVLMVMGSFETGGAERAALELLRALQGSGHEFTVVPLRAKGEMADEFRAQGATVLDALVRRRFDPLAVCRMARLIRSRRIDAVLIVDALRNGMFYGFLGSAIGRRGVARVCWCHSIPGRQGGRFVCHLGAYRRAGLLDAVVCVSRFQRRRLAESGLPRRRVVVIANGLDVERFARARETDLALPSGKRIVVSVANVMPDKDHATLLAAAEELSRVRQDVHFVLVGRGTDSVQMQRAVAGTGLETRVTLAGHQDDVPAILKKADVFVLTSRSETFGLACLEAMVMGATLIVSDLPALRELLRDAGAGLTVPPGDSHALAEALGRLIDDAALRERLCGAARRRAGFFTAERMAGKFDRLLRVLCGKRQGPQPRWS